MANTKVKDETEKKLDLNPEDLGLGSLGENNVNPENLKQDTKVKDEDKEIDEKIFNKGKKDTSYEEKKLEAAAAQAVKTAATANAEMALRDSEKAYALEKRKHMLDKCKNDKPVTITPSKLFANIFGTVYTFNFNGIPVTVRFDGTKQEFPKFIADKIQEKILSTSEANTPKEEIDELS